ncbi:hypothetical protein AMECASPLE_000534 [Ameca splendens]|uniref:Uncharacterized protein n=1 Tax=Ameca splendens TaxID=208324 RepID=A0ABV0XAE3_9TELE
MQKGWEFHPPDVLNEFRHQERHFEATPPSPSWQMAAHTESRSGSAGGFFLLKGSFSSPLSLHVCSVGGIAEKSMPTTVHCLYMLINEEGMLQVTDWTQSAGFP